MTVTIPTQEILRPNPEATNQTGFWSQSVSYSFHENKTLEQKYAVDTDTEAHLERVHVHWVDEGVGVVFRHSGKLS